MKTFIITQNSGFVITITNVDVVECDEMHTLCFRNVGELMHIMVDNEGLGGTILGDVHQIRIDTRSIEKIRVR